MFLQSKDKAFHVWQAVIVKVHAFRLSPIFWTNQVEITESSVT